ncbi:hypothetical protein PVAP13_1KG221500 [Panicum virgatum]|uniref:Uncharacterized protein n=1 Tax=Panicum virgatum TaxID=38727 RepID=A0A8T0XGZ2_PANVG|nr:hypothetical protein PVAP13_1KG221500 [Panicum virgatum]
MWHPAAGSSGAAASSPQAALPPRRPVQHGRPRPRDLTAAYACSASRHPIAGSSPRRRLLAPSCSSSSPLHNHAVLATGATSPRSQSSHPQAIESQLGMLGGQVKAPRRRQRAQSLNVQGPRRVGQRGDWGIWRKYVTRSSSARSSTRARKCSLPGTPMGTHLATSPPLPGIALGPGGPQIHRWTWQPARLIVWLKFMF